MKIRHRRALTNLGWLISVFIALSKDLGFSEQDRCTLVRRGKSEGISFFTKTLPILGKSLDRSLETKTLTIPCGHFKKRWRSGEIPAFGGSLFFKVFTKTGRLRDEPSGEAILSLRQLCFFAYKCDFPFSEQQEQDTLEGFLATEQKVVEWSKQSNWLDHDPLIRVARTLTKNVFSDFRIARLRPKHGPGVAANCLQHKKFTHTLTPQLPVYESHSSHFYFNANEAFEDLSKVSPTKHHDLFKRFGVAKVILVPKDSRGPRIISSEPVENQFIQQGIMRYMVDKLESFPLTAGQVNFTNQQYNQTIALESSKSGNFATLDLKEASDRNSKVLFDAIFKDCGELYESILQSRSAATELPDGTIVPLSKFAPMGSACCFPVMAYTIFILLYVNFVYRLGMDPELASKCIFVYGDDVAVPSQYFHETSSILEQYGFKVNTKKSFFNGKFRESCGVDAFNGKDVTPIRLRKPMFVRDNVKTYKEFKRLRSYDPYILRKVGPKRGVYKLCLKDGSIKRKNFLWSFKGYYPTSSNMYSIVETARQLQKRGCHLSAEYLYRNVEHVTGRLPFGKDGCGYLSRHYSDPDTVAEANFLRNPTFFRTVDDLQVNPLGAKMRVLCLKTHTCEDEATGLYSHLARTINKNSLYTKLRLGNTRLEEVWDLQDSGIETAFGVFDRPRQATLAFRFVDHYSL